MLIVAASWAALSVLVVLVGSLGYNIIALTKHLRIRLDASKHNQPDYKRR
jgi:hypothetical protein